MKRVLIIDTGLYFEQGHNFSLVNKLYEIYTSKDFDVEILALESSSDYLKEYYLKKKIKYFPIFTYNCYSSEPHENKEAFIEAVKQTTNQLSNYLVDKDEYDIVIWPPASSTVQFVTNLMFKIKSKKNFIFVERNPLSLTRMTEFFIPRLKERIKARQDIKILTTDYGSQKLHKDVFGIDTTLTPILTLSKKIPNTNKLSNIGVFGVYRNTSAYMKGIYDIFKKFPKITFHIHDPWGVTQKRDEKLVKEIKNIKFFEFEFDLSKKIASFQAVINHLYPKLYKYLNSGILCESIAVGRPLLTPRYTNSSNYIEENKNGILYDYSDSSQIADGIFSLTANYSKYKKNSENLAKAWEEINGLNKIVELTL